MADIAMLILKGIDEIITMAGEVENVGQQADRLVKRLRSIEEPVRAVEKKYKSPALSLVLSIVQEAHEFLSKYFKLNRLQRAYNRKSHADIFTDLSDRYDRRESQRMHYKTTGVSPDLFREIDI